MNTPMDSFRLKKRFFYGIAAIAMSLAGCTANHGTYDKRLRRTADAKVAIIACGNQDERSEAIKFLARWVRDGTEDQKWAAVYNWDAEPQSEHKPGLTAKGKVLLLAIPNLIEELKNSNRRNAAVVLAKLTSQESKANEVSLKYWGDWWLREGHYQYANQAFEYSRLPTESQRRSLGLDRVSWPLN
jgi:hypothetical protein